MKTMNELNQANNSKSSLLDQALYYREKLGWSVIPIGKDKRPLIEWKEFQIRKATREKIIKWWTNCPDTNIGVVTGKISGITVVDIDPRNGGSFVSFNRIITITVNTGGGGKHYYFIYDQNVPSIDLKNGIEIKNDGRYVILPPSAHPNGNKYDWSMSPQANTQLIALPRFVQDWVKNKQPQYARFDSNILKGVFSGQRNITATSLIGKLLILFPKEEWQSGALEFVRWWNTNKNSPPLSGNELDTTFQSIAKREILKSTNQSIHRNDLLTNEPLQILTYQQFIELVFPPNSWLVDRLIPKDGITCISGQPKVGKSMLSLYLAVCIATGINFLGHFETEKAGVLYISKDEPMNLTQSRLKKMVVDSNGELPITFISDTKLFFDSDRYISQLLTIIDSNQIKVIIIDSFRRIFRGNENESQTINEVQNRLKKIQEKGVTIIFIHHHGKGGFFKRTGGDKLRGSSDILAMLDSLLLIEQVGDEKIKITQAALRTDKSLSPFIVQLNSLHPQKLDFEFIDFIKEEDEKKDMAKEDVLKLLDESDERLNQTSIIQLLTKDKRYGDTTVKNALKELAETKQISMKREGKKKIYEKVKSGQ